MLLLVAVQFLTLVVAAVLLAYEARTGRLEGTTEREVRWRAAIFLVATVAGAALLIALADSEWLFALALVPITILCLLRFAMLARRWWTGWRLTAVTCVLVGVGIGLSVPFMPFPLDRTVIVRELQGIDGVSAPPDTIDPEALRPVRA